MKKENSRDLQHNKELAVIFSRMADCYRYLGPEQRFRAMAYSAAAQTLRNMKEPVDSLAVDIRQLDALKGIGSGIAAKIIEYLATGHIKNFEALQKKVPFQLLELMDIEGIGPATLRVLHEKLKVKTKEELAGALEKGRLEKLKGFGQKKIDNLAQALKLETRKKRLPYREAKKMADDLLAAVKKIEGIRTAVIAGSVRRKKETIGDIDIVLTADEPKWKKIITTITQMPLVKEVLAAGKTRASVLLKEKNVQADIRIVHEEEFGAALFYFTGSKEHNIQLRAMAKQRGWKVNEYGVFDNKTGRKLAGRTEEDIYALLGIRFIPPEQRTGGNEININLLDHS
ncbi:MAG TPA: helix-hairpin-helix domain-containing protein [Chitinophagaceae bacterium]|nr:helix-hairpin-helix domain-containing protein [Chitinophagaceae bacterium]